MIRRLGYFFRSRNIITSIIALVLGFLFQTSISAETPKMLLVGGGLKICSSYSEKNCKAKIKWPENTYRKKHFQVSKSVIQQIDADPFQQFKSIATKNEVLELLNKYQIRNRPEPLARKQILKQLDNISLTSNGKSGREVLDDLNSFQMRFLMQALELPVVSKDGEPLTEFTALAQSNPHSVRIVEKFFQQVKHTSLNGKPLILISTASSKDVFDAVSFYLNLFGQDGFDVAWLPIEASLNEVMTDSNLSCRDLENVRAEKYGVFNRSLTYPKLAEYQLAFCQNPEWFTQLIERANGIFFNGGDQYLTLSALANLKKTKGKPTKSFNRIYDAIKRKYHNGQLVIAGTSAGTAVQSGGVDSLTQEQIPMVTNGISLEGFFSGSHATFFPPSNECEIKGNCGKGIHANSLTRFSPGGLDLMPLGIFDTHFSERDRGLRMLRLMADAKLSLGIGVDENTALIVKGRPENIKLEVVGEGGVWLFQNNTKSSVANFNGQSFVVDVLAESDTAFVKKQTLETRSKIRVNHFKERKDKFSRSLVSISNSGKKLSQTLNYKNNKANLQFTPDKKIRKRFMLEVTQFEPAIIDD